MSDGYKILFVSYHFRPSLLVGARRPTATVDGLISRGHKVTVLRGVLPRLPSDIDSDDFEIRYVDVKILPKKRSRIINFVKSILKPGQLDKPETSSATTELSRDSQVESKTISFVSVRGFLTETIALLRGVDGSIQYRKYWLLVAMIKLLPSVLFKRHDLVIASGPPMASFLCGWLAAILSRSPLLFDYRDPWYLYGESEHAELDSSNTHALTGKFENWMARRSVARCSAVITASNGIRRHLIESLGVSSERIHVVPNGFDKDALVTAAPPKGSLEILYAGSLYWNRNPFPFLEALSRFVSRQHVDRDRVRLRMVGHCEYWNGVELVPWLKDHGLEDVVTIGPYVAPEMIRHFTEESNLLLNFAQGQPRQIPAKSFEYIAAQRFTLVLAEENSDVARLFSDVDCGRVVSPNDTDAIEEVLGEIYLEVTLDSDTATTFDSTDVDRFSRETQVDRFAQIINKLIKV